MLGISINEAAAYCGGSVYGTACQDGTISNVIFDSRILEPGDMFIAYRSESADGHNFIPAAFGKGASCALAEYVPEGVSGPIIVCDDVQTALEKIICGVRKKMSIPFIGITGSVGKTTAKEMVSSVLGTHYKVHKNKGNFNNLIGVPVTISEIENEHEIAVVEMGINHFGEMSHLASMVQPDVAFFTLIGHAHLEFLGDLNGVLKAKTEMLRFMKDDALLIVNGDDQLLRSFECRQRKLTFGKNKECDVRAENIRNDADGNLTFDICYEKRCLPVSLNSYGEHMVYAALEGAAAGFLFGLGDEEIISGIGDYKPVGRRAAYENTGYITLIDDCYNANPDSTKSSINSLSTLNGRKVCILGDMLELGSNAEKMHFEIGSYAREKGVEVLLSCGSLGRYIVEGFGENAFWFESTQDIIKALPGIIKKEDNVLVKASKGAWYGVISEALKEL